MYRTAVGEISPATDGRVDMSFKDANGWADFGGGKILGLLLGDDTSGPYLFFSSYGPMPEEMARGFAHGHDSDNWRISIQGTTNMGKYAYTQGQFRFQDGGVPYPGDNLAWGPQGGYGIVMFGDRRGWPIRPVDKERVAAMESSQAGFSTQMGIDVVHPCPGAPAIRTTLGKTSHGHLDGGFDTAADWPEIATGTRAAISVMGERTVGPVLVLLQSEPGASAVPAVTVATETLHVVSGGSCVVAGEHKGIGDFWLAEAGAQPEVVAGPEGLSHTLLITDRRALTSIEAEAAARGWTQGMSKTVAELLTQLQAA